MEAYRLGCKHNNMVARHTGRLTSHSRWQLIDSSVHTVQWWRDTRDVSHHTRGGSLSTRLYTRYNGGETHGTSHITLEVAAYRLVCTHGTMVARHTGRLTSHSRWQLIDSSVHTVQWWRDTRDVSHHTRGGSLSTRLYTRYNGGETHGRLTSHSRWQLIDSSVHTVQWWRDTRDVSHHTRGGSLSTRLYTRYNGGETHGTSHITLEVAAYRLVCTHGTMVARHTGRLTSHSRWQLIDSSVHTVQWWRDTRDVSHHTIIEVAAYRLVCTHGTMVARHTGRLTSHSRWQLIDSFVHTVQWWRDTRDVSHHTRGGSLSTRLYTRYNGGETHGTSHITLEVAAYRLVCTHGTMVARHTGRLTSHSRWQLIDSFVHTVQWWRDTRDVPSHSRWQLINSSVHIVQWWRDTRTSRITLRDHSRGGSLSTRLYTWYNGGETPGTSHITLRWQLINLSVHPGRPTSHSLCRSILILVEVAAYQLVCTPGTSRHTM
ncbi:hypothetical protein J6590_078089 [Homalodisca vitripennis]|nr:hypothetical protein J6590_078089 [Homalodisca vitripennis]